jgi:excisionase family DNA binding protein
MHDQWFTYAEAAERLGVSKQAIRQKVIRGRWPRTRGNDGQARIQIPEQPYALRTPSVRGPDVATLQAQIEALRAELARAEECSRGHRADYERERVRADQLVATLDSISAELAGVRQKDEERRIAEIEAAAVPALRDTIAALKAALDAEQARNRDLRRARDAGGPLYRVLRWMRKVG